MTLVTSNFHWLVSSSDESYSDVIESQAAELLFSLPLKTKREQHIQQRGSKEQQRQWCEQILVLVRKLWKIARGNVKSTCVNTSLLSKKKSNGRRCLVWVAEEFQRLIDN
jgi:hypothetical protein